MKLRRIVGGEDLFWCRSGHGEDHPAGLQRINDSKNDMAHNGMTKSAQDQSLNIAQRFRGKSGNLRRRLRWIFGSLGLVGDIERSPNLLGRVIGVPRIESNGKLIVRVNPAHEGVGMVLNWRGRWVDHKAHDVVENVADTIDEHLDVIAELTVIGGSHDQVLANDDEPGEVDGAPAIKGDGQAVGLIEHLVC